MTFATFPTSESAFSASSFKRVPVKFLTVHASCNRVFPFDGQYVPLTLRLSCRLKVLSVCLVLHGSCMWLCLTKKLIWSSEDYSSRVVGRESWSCLNVFALLS